MIQGVCFWFVCAACLEFGLVLRWLKGSESRRTRELSNNSYQRDAGRIKASLAENEESNKLADTVFALETMSASFCYYLDGCAKWCYIWVII